MSGEKCTSYSVIAEQNRLREEARLRELQAEASAAETGLAELLRRAATIRIETEIPHLAGGASPDQLQRYIAAARGLGEEINAKLLRREMLQKLVSFADSGGVGEYREEAVPDAERDKTEAERAKRHALVTRLIDRLTAPVPDEVIAIQALAGKLVECADSKRVARLEDELRHAIQTANEGATRRRAAVDRSIALRDELQGLGGAEVIRLREELARRAAASELPSPDLVARVAQVRDSARAEIDRRYLVETLRAEFDRQGYAVSQDELTAAVVKGGEVILLDRKSADYGVRLSAHAGVNNFTVEMVRFDDGRPLTQLQERRDKEAEDDFCPRFGAVRRGLNANGIENALERQLPAGLRRVRALKRSDSVPEEAVRRIARPRSKTLPS